MQDFKTLAIEMLEGNKPLVKIRSALEKHIKQQDVINFENILKAEYDLLFPYSTTVSVLDDNGDIQIVEEVIDYTNYVGYMTFEEYKNETRVVTAFQDAVYDVDGVTLISEEVPEVTELVRPYVPLTISTTDIDSLLHSLSEYATYQSVNKEKELEQLTVTNNTVAYDANGKAIGNMSAVLAVANAKHSKAIADGLSSIMADTVMTSDEKNTAAQLLTIDTYEAIFKSTTIGWKGADNDVHYVQLESIAEALEKSMLALANVIGV